MMVIIFFITLGYDGPLQFTMVHGNPDANETLIPFQDNNSQDSDGKWKQLFIWEPYAL